MTAYGEVERELAVLLRRARAWNRDLATEVHRDLQPTAYALLSRIEEQVSLRASDLSDYFGIDKGADQPPGGAAGALGLVRREPDPDDGRAQRLVVTEEGRKRMTRARERPSPRRPRAAGPLAGVRRRDLRRAAGAVQRADGCASTSARRT